MFWSREVLKWKPKFYNALYYTVKVFIEHIISDLMFRNFSVNLVEMILLTR